MIAIVNLLTPCPGWPPAFPRAMIERPFDRTSVRRSTTNHRQNRVLPGVSFEQVFDLLPDHG
jgi:hypothetical protein